MKRFWTMTGGGLLLVLLVATGMGSGAATGPAADGAADGSALAERLRALRPDIPIERVSSTPIPGIFALEIVGGQVFYGTGDGRYLFAGDLYELGDDELINVAEAARAEKRHAVMAGIDPKDMIVFKANGDRKTAISVFTDVDCVYCQKLHLEVPKLNEMGIEVRYLAYPRAGIGSPSYDKIVSAWCAKDPNDALTRVKAGETIPALKCRNPVAAQFDLGRQLGVAGTPAIILEDGRLLPGYLPAEQLARAVGI
jgi:thiol:disulfide interchange protein DsbC